MTNGLQNLIADSKTSKSSCIPQQTTDERAVGTLPGFVAEPNPYIYRYGSFVCLDFETTNLDKGSALNRGNRVVLGRWGVDGSWDNQLSTDRATHEVLFAALDACDFLLAHNAKFELQWLRRLGYDRDLVVYDTMLGEYVLAGNRKLPLGLDALALKYLGTYEDHPVSKLIQDGVCPSSIDPDALDEYCAKDVQLTLDVFFKQLEVLDELNLLPVLYTRCLLTPVLADIEMRGMALDRAKVKEYYTEYNEKLNDLKQKISDFTGGVNPNSPKQMAAYLYDELKLKELVDRNGRPVRTPTGGRCTDVDTICALKATNKSQRQFIELYKDYGSLRVNTNSLKKMLECCEAYPEDQVPILYAQFNQTVTQTHRLSSSGREFKLQFQNFNRDFKPLFTFRNKGWSVGEADGAQLEFRVAAHLGRDHVAVKDIRDPSFDVHYQTAETILRRSRDGISKEERTLVKPKTFRPLYGGMAGTEDERAYYKFFQNKYRGIYSTQQHWTHEVARSKKLRTETGLIFYWPNCKVEQDGYITNRTSIFNYPVQSLATADIIPIGVVCAYYRMRFLNLSSFLVNTVHDSIIGEVAPGEERTFRDICNTALTSDAFEYLRCAYNIRFTVPLGCESKIGTNWGQGEEEKFDLDPDNYFTRQGN